LAADAASFAAGDYILLYSNKSVDTEEPSKHAGEVKKIVTVDPTAGLLTIDDQIFDSYTRADSAQVVRITMLRNLTLSDFSVTTQASFSNLRVGFTHFRFVENLQIERMEVYDVLHRHSHAICPQFGNFGLLLHHISDIVPINPPNPVPEQFDAGGGREGLRWQI
jgi:hypothetical protein